MEVHMNFEKKTLSKRVGKFLEENIQDQEEKESVRKIMQGRKLQYLAANKLILTLITAMVMEPLYRAFEPFSGRVEGQGA